MSTTYTHPAARPKGLDVGRLIMFVNHQLRTLAAGPVTLNGVLGLERTFLELRRIAERDGAPLSGHIDELRAARVEFEKLKLPLATMLVDALNGARQQLQAAKEREEELREAVAWLSRSSGRKSLPGKAAQASVETRVRRSIPRAGTPARIELERTVRDSGVWDRVSILSAPTLEKELARRDFPSEARGRIEPLCPRRATSTVRVRPAG